MVSLRSTLAPGLSVGNYLQLGKISVNFLLVVNFQKNYNPSTVRPECSIQSHMYHRFYQGQQNTMKCATAISHVWGM